MAPLLSTRPGTGAWAERRRRVRELLDRYPFATSMLKLYAGLLDAQERAFALALEDQPAPDEVARYVAERVLASIVEETVAGAPPALAEASRIRFAAGGLEALVGDWLAGEIQPAVDTYLARAAAGPVLEALGRAAGQACRGPRDAGHCPTCGGRPQVSCLADSGESLVTVPRYLVCCRCSTRWIHERMACPACGERSTAKLPIYSDGAELPHIRAEACETCRQYVLTVDLRKDAGGVPLVDELAALPLDLHVQERGFTKIVPNLMGIG
ncbi:MAG TPA: formate dehydrogenase accessory protein FdhE [Candidatus Methylomirabilis sp.]|nr:formate dehydrogenase accessory protein FdhE [Candidatus Methylomirabilis sp.]